MSIIVKGMELPKNCYGCLTRDPISDYCELLFRYLDREELSGRDTDCPLAELPEKHGRLIDASKLKETLDYYIAEAGWGPGVNEVLGWVKEFIDSEPTIVEQEGEDVR